LIVFRKNKENILKQNKENILNHNSDKSESAIEHKSKKENILNHNIIQYTIERKKNIF